MAQSDWFARAQEGDAEAIALLLNQVFRPRNVVATVSRQGDRLEIRLTADRALDSQAFVSYLRRQFARYQMTGIRQVRVYSQPLSVATPLWQEEFELSPPESAIVLRPLPRSPELGGFWTNLRSFQFSSVFPYHDVFSKDLYRNALVRLLLFFGLFPLLVDLLSDQSSLDQIAWLLGIYYASIWGVVLHTLIKPPQFAWSDTLKCVLFTTFIGIPLLLTFQRIPPFNLLYSATESSFVFRLVGFVLGVGVLEEICKGLPVYLFLLRPRKLSDPLTAAFYSAMSGLGFAIAEGATYSLAYGFGLSLGRLNLSSYVVANTIRFVSLPLFHAILSGIVGYFIGLAAINPNRQGAILFIGVAIAASLHGLYNTFAGSALGLLLIAFSILLFVAYLHRSQQMVDEMQRAEEIKEKD